MRRWDWQAADVRLNKQRVAQRRRIMFTPVAEVLTALSMLVFVFMFLLWGSL